MKIFFFLFLQLQNVGYFRVIRKKTACSIHVLFPTVIKSTMWAEPFSISFSLCLILECRSSRMDRSKNLARELCVRFFLKCDCEHSSPHAMRPWWHIVAYSLNGPFYGTAWRQASQATTKVICQFKQHNESHQLFNIQNIFKNHLGTSLNP